MYREKCAAVTARGKLSCAEKNRGEGESGERDGGGGEDGRGGGCGEEQYMAVYNFYLCHFCCLVENVFI